MGTVSRQNTGKAKFQIDYKNRSDLDIPNIGPQDEEEEGSHINVFGTLSSGDHNGEVELEFKLTPKYKYKID
jgi:hypothetical protein